MNAVEAAKTTCARHPKVETALTCASCGVPICPKCLVQTPVGMKCRDCGTQQGGVLFTPGIGQAALASVFGVLFGAVAGWGVAFLGFYSLFVAVAYGTFAGEMILRAASRKRGLRMELIAGTALAVGAIGGRMAVAAIPPSMGPIGSVIDLVIPTPIPLIALGIAVASAVGRIRYI